MNGWETLKALRAMHPGVPFLLASGYGTEIAGEGDQLNRPDAFLRKPYRREQLLEAIRKALTPLMKTEGSPSS